MPQETIAPDRTVKVTDKDILRDLGIDPRREYPAHALTKSGIIYVHTGLTYSGKLLALMRGEYELIPATSTTIDKDGNFEMTVR